MLLIISLLWNGIVIVYASLYFVRIRVYAGSIVFAKYKYDIVLVIDLHWYVYGCIDWVLFTNQPDHNPSWINV